MHAVPRLVPGAHYEFLLVFAIRLKDGTQRFIHARVAALNGVLTTMHLMSGVRSIAHEFNVDVDDVVVMNAIGPLLVELERAIGIDPNAN
ncbi:MAG TPA: hypothetical protein VHI13_05315 [Candidatus Kapabacteria bacterium]|nr:hypothetical protein [Candidatus Kapabacteria bacterium]